MTKARLPLFRPVLGASVIALCCAAAPGLAGPATPEGAARLTAVFQTYLGQTPGVVRVTPQGDAYSLRLDPAPLIALIPMPGARVSVTPQVMTLTELGGGKWQVVQDQPVQIDVVATDDVAMTLAVDLQSLRQTGIWDETLRAFETNTATLTGLTMNQTVASPDGGEMGTRYTIDRMDYSSTAVAAVGGVDVEARYAISGLSQTQTLLPGMEIGLQTETYDVVSRMTGLRSRGLTDLLAWAVAHPNPEAVQSDQAGLKLALAQALPLFETLNGSGAISGVAVETPMGPLSIDTVGFEVEANGVVNAGLVREAIQVDGLTLAPGMVPAWANALVPGSFGLDFALRDFDLAAPAAILLDVLDLADPELGAAGLEDRLLSALLPGGAVTLALAPGRASAPAYDLTWEGAMQAGPIGDPTGRATISLRGLDAIVAALNDAPEETRLEITPGLAFLQGLARPRNGALVWELDATTPGKFVVNGMDMSPLINQP